MVVEKAARPVRADQATAKPGGANRRTEIIDSKHNNVKGQVRFYVKLYYS